MDLTRLLDLSLPPPSPTAHSDGGKHLQVDETSCGKICQHPSCWASQRRMEKGIVKVLPPLAPDSDSSDDELSLPTQSVCNLLGDYGDNSSDRYPLSTGGRPSHQWDAPVFPSPRIAQSLNSGYKLTAPHNTTASLQSKVSQRLARNPRLRLVEVQEVFDREDLNSVWDETFVTKQYYVWVPNPNKRGRKPKRLPPTTRDTQKSHPVLMKDLTESMVPSEIEHRREETVLFDEWPVLKKRQQRTRSPPSKSVAYRRAAQVADAITADDNIDREGINELLALPRETLLKVLEHTKKSDFTSKGKLHSIVQHCTRDDEQAQLALTAREMFQHRQVNLQQDRSEKHSPTRVQEPRPVFQLDDDGVIDRLSSVNTPVKEKDLPYSDADSVDSFPRYKRPLPGIAVDYGVSKPKVMNQMAKIPSISLGLPELPSGVKTTKPFSYKKQNFDFSLGRVFSPPSSYRSSISGDYSEHGTTVKVNASSTMIGHLESYNRDRDGESMGMAIHSVSPALSTHVPVPPAGTPATFQSPTKSAPVFRDYRDISRDPTQLTMNWSQRAQPPSRDIREDTLLSSPAQVGQIFSPMDLKPVNTPDDQGLDTINETARENQDGSVSSSRLAKTDKLARTPVEIPEEAPPGLQLETSMLRSIDTAASPLQKTARSVESCPSPEQWPLISESSFERMPRHSVSEPALSARSDRRRPISRGKSDLGKGGMSDYARKVMDEKISAESPAPPPPSPEPKDMGEFRSRKDLKSRDSLSMAPLFEVTELEESSPVRELEERGREERSKKLEVKIPMGKSKGSDRSDKDEQEGEMVSQITVMHVMPKGRDPDKRKDDFERVQETFLNVDIPAEDVSSLKAEHGSSHQEDISSNDTVVISHSTATGSETSPTPRGPDSEVKGDSESQEVENTDASLAVIAENGQGKLATDLNMEEEKGDERDGGSVNENLNASGESPELLCDSARFFSHDLVSPIEDEKEAESDNGDKNHGDGEMEVVGERPEVAGGNNDVNNEESSNQLAGGSKGNDEDVEPPGLFFFKSSPEEDKSQEKETTEPKQEADNNKKDGEDEDKKGGDGEETTAVYLGSQATDKEEGGPDEKEPAQPSGDERKKEESHEQTKPEVEGKESSEDEQLKLLELQAQALISESLVKANGMLDIQATATDASKDEADPAGDGNQTDELKVITEASEVSQESVKENESHDTGKDTDGLNKEDELPATKDKDEGSKAGESREDTQTLDVPSISSFSSREPTDAGNEAKDDDGDNNDNETAQDDGEHETTKENEVQASTGAEQEAEVDKSEDKEVTPDTANNAAENQNQSENAGADTLPRREEPEGAD